MDIGPLPQCLCPLVAGNPGMVADIDIYRPSEGPWAGQYVGQCATDSCGYFSEYFSLRQFLRSPFYVNSAHRADLQ